MKRISFYVYNKAIDAIYLFFESIIFSILLGFSILLFLKE